MGNALRLLFKQCCGPTTRESDSLGPHGVSAHTVGFTALARDLLHFEVTSQVPEGLSQHVVSSRKRQANWYRKILQAWKEAKPPPRTPEEAAGLIIETLQRHTRSQMLRAYLTSMVFLSHKLWLNCLLICHCPPYCLKG